nr:MAG: hypothetical protein [Bacteriophage sp.]
MTPARDWVTGRSSLMASLDSPYWLLETSLVEVFTLKVSLESSLLISLTPVTMVLGKASEVASSATNLSS